MNRTKERTFHSNLVRSLVCFLLVALTLIGSTIATGGPGLLGTTAYAASTSWQIDAPSTVTVVRGQTTSVTIRFMGAGISSYTGSISNTDMIGASFSNANWQPAGQWCSTTLNLTGKKTGTATVTFTLKGSTTVNKTIKVTVVEPSDWEIQAPTSVTVEKGKSTYIDIKFRGTGIDSYSGSISNSSAVGANFSNPQWKSAGQWCSVRLNLTGKVTGSATVTFTLNGSTTLCKSITINVIQPTTTLVDANLSKTNYIKQGSKTCKATAAAMTLNLLTGKNSYTTAGLGGSNFVGIEGKSYVASDGNTYVATSKADNYVGSAAEQKAAIDKAIANGLPIVVAVHSTRSGYTKHHWVIIVGKSGNDYLIVDPASGSSGSMAANVKTMSSAHYEFGLTDYSTPHYGYICFTRK